MSKLLGSAAIAVFLACAAPLAAGAAATTFHATLNGATEVPPTTSTGTGEATATLDPATGALSYKVTFSGLTGAATMAHIHGPAAPGVNAKVLVPLGMAPASPIVSSKTLTPDQVAALNAGKLYVNVHTAAHPGGEIRGQLVAGQ